MASVVPLPPDFDELPTELLTIDTHSVDSIELQKSIKRAGRALVEIFSSANISTACRDALDSMAASGKALDLRFVAEIKNTGVLVECARIHASSLQNSTLKQLVELRQAMAACATATISSTPVVELLSLWAIVHESVSEFISKEGMQVVARMTADAPAALQVAASADENAAAIGKLLTAALASSTELASSMSRELREAVQHFAESGKPIADNLVKDLDQVLREHLSEQDWQELLSRCSQSIASEWSTLGDVVKKVSTHAEEVARLAKVEVSEVFDSPFAKAIISQGFAGLDGALGHSREAVDVALDAVRGSGAAAFGTVAACLVRSGFPPLLRVEIARDFFQTVGLFLSGLYASVLEYFERHHVANALNSLFNGLRGVYDVLAINVLALVEQVLENQALLADIALGVLIVAIAIVYMSYLWFVFSGRHLHRRADEVRQGHEAVTWAALASKQQMRVKLFTFVITSCLTVYLPLTRLCLDVVIAEVMTNSYSTDSNKPASTSELVLARFQYDAAWPAIVGAAALILLTFTIPLPWLLIRAILENRPTGSLENPLVTYDLDGEEVPFDDKVYARLVARDPSQLRCPYRSLYAGFEQRWSYYKVLQLLVKLVLALVIVTTARGDARIRGIMSCAIYACVVALSSYGTPFSDPLNNVMEISGKVAALTTCVGGALAAFVDLQSHKSLEIVAIVVSVVHLVNLFVMLVVLLLGIHGARLFVKNVLGWITFSDTSRGLEDAPAKHILPRWDVNKEAKHRVWQAFWRSVLLELTQSTCKSKGSIEGLTVAHRLEALEQAVVASGVRHIRSHWRGEEDAYTCKLRQAIRAALEGVDVFWNDDSGARDGRLDSKSCFGKMYVMPYPFHCVMVYDDAKDEAIIRDDVDVHGQSKLAKLLFLNFTPNVIAKRELRQKLRVLSTQAISIHFPFSRQEQATVEDGTVTKRDSKGNTHTETRYSTVTFMCYYTSGIIHVASKDETSKRVMAEGFDVSMTYRDGHGDAVAPHTGKVHHLHNRVVVMGPEHIGLTWSMEESEQLCTIFDQTKSTWMSGIKELHAHHQQYRRHLDQKHRTANGTLSDAFWYFVYNNPQISRQELQAHLERREENPQLRALAQTHQSALDSLYLRMGFLHSHPAVTFWFVFWDDVYTRNCQMKRLCPFKTDLDPRQSNAICYRVMRRPDLESWLKARKMLGTRRLFHPRLLDLLYSEMDKRLKEDKVIHTRIV